MNQKIENLSNYLQHKEYLAYAFMHVSHLYSCMPVPYFLALQGSILMHAFIRCVLYRLHYLLAVLNVQLQLRYLLDAISHRI